MNTTISKPLLVTLGGAIVLWWAHVAVTYIWPIALYLFQLLEQNQGTTGATVSMYFVGLIALWVYYLAVMNLKRAVDNKEAPTIMMVLGFTLVAPPAIVLDWIMNIVLTVPFLDPPRGWRTVKVFGFEIPYFTTELVTGRLKRYRYDQTQTWRRYTAIVFAMILDAADPAGIHV